MAEIGQGQGDADARQMPQGGADGRLPQDDPVDELARSAHGAQGAELGQVIDGGGIEHLGDDHSAHQQPQEGGDQHRRPGAGSEHPVVAGAGGKVRAQVDIATRQGLGQGGEHLPGIGPRGEGANDIVGLLRPQTRQALGVAEGGEDPG